MESIYGGRFTAEALRIEAAARASSSEDQLPKTGAGAGPGAAAPAYGERSEPQQSKQICTAAGNRAAQATFVNLCGLRCGSRILPSRGKSGVGKQCNEKKRRAAAAARPQLFKGSAFLPQTVSISHNKISVLAFVKSEPVTKSRNI